jgi:3-hydroxyacyl-[acyl-carrier-protein] dehydratase
MLFVDRVTALTDMTIQIESDISKDAPYFAGHFPRQPIMPGVLIVETVAQAGALLVSLRGDLADDKFIAFTGLDNVKFKRPVYPDCMIVINVEIKRVRGPFYKFEGQVTLNGDIATSLAFSAAQIDFNRDP